ncbi:MAG: hypothetical protein LBS24_07360 [Clostridiales Family XIII bacterium]|jgi:hypothetical protein|nr:hypothetical protein [Clostridiales Family XIII bacterium]
MNLYLTETIGLTERERELATKVISAAGFCLREASGKKDRFSHGTQGILSLVDEEAFYAVNETALAVAGGFLCELFDCKERVAEEALRALAARKDAPLWFPAVVEVCHEEILRISAENESRVKSDGFGRKKQDAEKKED